MKVARAVDGPLLVVSLLLLLLQICWTDMRGETLSPLLPFVSKEGSQANNQLLRQLETTTTRKEEAVFWKPTTLEAERKP